MHIAILTAGSRGDVQPYLALGLALKEAGHHVKLATHVNFRAWIEQHGLEYAELNGNPREMTEMGEASKWVDSGRSLIKHLDGFKQVMLPILTRLMHDTWEAAKGADLLLPSSLCYYPAYIASREQGIPWIQTFLQPHHPTSAFPTALVPTRRSYGKFGNLLSHYVGGLLLWQAMRPAFNEILEKDFQFEPFRWEGILTEVEKAGIPGLYAYSPSFLPKPRDWSQHLHVTGYWFLDEGKDWTPPARLVDFIDAGPAPVSVGFGSMPVGDPEQITEMIIDALRKAGQRGIILTGWGGLQHNNLPDDLLMIENAPHDWLFPRMAAVVHHGGAGTTGAGLRAGKPSVIVPFFGDQLWWGMRVYERGAGPKPIPRDKVSSDNLALAIKKAVTNWQIREQAQCFDKQIRSEDGISQALTLIEQQV